jgi:hypothetical protein
MEPSKTTSPIERFVIAAREMSKAGIATLKRMWAGAKAALDDEPNARPMPPSSETPSTSSSTSEPTKS